MINAVESLKGHSSPRGIMMKVSSTYRNHTVGFSVAVSRAVDLNSLENTSSYEFDADHDSLRVIITCTNHLRSFIVNLPLYMISTNDFLFEESISI